MTIRWPLHPKCEEDAINALKTGLRAGGLLSDLPRSTVMISGPFPVYGVRREQLNGKKRFAPREIRAWRYCLIRRGKIATLMDLIDEEAGSCLTPSISSAGGEELGDAIQCGELLMKPEKEYSFAIIEVPDARLKLLWVRPVRGTADRFVVIPPTFPPFANLAVFTRTGLAGAILQLPKRARQRRRPKASARKNRKSR